MTLKRLERSPDWEVKEGETDIRGWSVFDVAGGEIGQIDGLLFDDATRRVVYAIVRADERHVLVPVGELDLDESGRRVLTRSYDRARLSALEPYDESRFDDQAEAAYYRSHVPDWRGDRRPDYESHHFRQDVPQPFRLMDQRLRAARRDDLAFAGSEPRIEADLEEETHYKERLDLRQRGQDIKLRGDRPIDT